MVILENYSEISNEGSYFIITIPFDKDSPFLKINFDIDSEVVEVEGNQYTVNDCLISDNGEWINLLCDRISAKRERERQRIGRRIAEIRKTVPWTDENGIDRKGMTQRELAQLCGLQNSHIARIEKGRYSVGFDTLQSIADAMGYDIDLVRQ